MIKTYRFLCSLKFIISILEWSCFPKIVMVHKTRGGGGVSLILDPLILKYTIGLKRKALTGLRSSKMNRNE